MARRYYSSRQPRSYNSRIRKGRTFRRGNKLVRHVYRGSKKIGTEIVKHIGYGAKRYIRDRTYRYLNKRWGR